MLLEKIKCGKNFPEDINVVIEIPANSLGVKYEFDKETGAITVDRFINVAMHYPFNYGFVPNTLGDDNDPIDVLVITKYPLQPGSVINAKPVGVLIMEDESGGDEKIVAVPTAKLDKSFANINNIEDLDESLKLQIYHFFERYKDLEPNKWVKVKGWSDANEAKRILTKSKNNFQV
ncbi:MAG: inorganic diphosphatase [Rickettsiaceae bacterium]|nr:inorganic diphosphatase [Rickettsiaceae bacterium]